MTKSREEITNHDLKILKGEMQSYALDYFLAAQNIFNIGDAEIRKTLILKGYQRLPSLRDDAISNDMLNKVVCSLWDWFLKVRLTKDFYEYRTSLVGVEEKLGDDQIKNIGIALKKYCLNLLDVLESYGISEVSPGTASPYGKSSVLDIKNKLI